ncbi:hypothetical protein V8E54_012050 [Elaphomyces granulatus]
MSASELGDVHPREAWEYKARLAAALGAKRERVVDKKRPYEDDEDNTISDNSGVINPPEEVLPPAPVVLGAKGEKLDRAAKLHTFCYHSHFFKGEVLEELWPQATYGNCHAWRRGRQLFMGSVKRFKNEIIGPEGTITKYMEELMKANPIIAPEDASTSGLTAHLKAEFSHTDFLQVFIYLKSFLDWEKTPKEGRAYCRALFLNLAIQAKKQIHKDAAAKARGKIVGMPRNEEDSDEEEEDDKLFWKKELVVCRKHQRCSRSRRMINNTLRESVSCDAGDIKKSSFKLFVI